MGKKNSYKELREIYICSITSESKVAIPIKFKMSVSYDPVMLWWKTNKTKSLACFHKEIYCGITCILILCVCFSASILNSTTLNLSHQLFKNISFNLTNCINYLKITQTVSFDTLFGSSLCPVLQCNDSPHIATCSPKMHSFSTLSQQITPSVVCARLPAIPFYLLQVFYFINK